MIPTMIVVGLLVGRWWIIPLGGAAWAGLLLATGTCNLACSPGAFAFGAANAAVGAAAHIAAAHVFKAGRRAAGR